MDSEQLKFYNDSDIYFQSLKEAPREYFEEYISFVSFYLDKGAVLLDIGCGTGQSTELLGEAGYRVAGVDGSERYIKYARLKHPSAKFVHSDIQDLTFETDSIEAVGTYNTVEHFSDPEENLKEIIRIVKPGGYILVNAPNLLSINHAVNALLKYKGMTFEGKKSVAGLFYIFFRNIFWLFCSRLFPKKGFRRRKPVFDYNFSDNDATFFLNPTDLKNFFENNGCDTVSYQKIDFIKKKTLMKRIGSSLFPDFMGIIRLVVKKRIGN
jgi:ubiquinone/menaquinone biosynthesis C-methylase UbiE